MIGVFVEVAEIREIVFWLHITSPAGKPQKQPSLDGIASKFMPVCVICCHDGLTAPIVLLPNTLYQMMAASSIMMPT